ncbi:Lipoprotein-releasing system ATP-binding protein LolD [Acholeplasma oculi]|uniref:ABC transporter, ATP-binding protein n=1 Tax=Acholeplasma oculi TaxID=35623 RepID=A0A061A9D9_9MOLU|nr:ABC transporter ATP-binding protein [Acholeplasma oculi]CDR30510.1 ABC transporter, ATP-binding protein [Acholeplasma oculi]SKC47789.1 putative ABC transport system ATP-binding protein [Acholeplasma oculi]SUT89157.1 Lipoprotein-releasing system ATP-binding protein LolD [Acholeplasma oculi]
MYKLQNIYKSYDKEKTFILNDLYFDVNEGDFVAIIGKSGSGKSTLLNILSTIDTPTKGYYIFNDKNLTKLNDNQLAEFRNQSIGVVFQSYHLIEDYTVGENVMLPLMFSNQKKQPNLDGILEKLDILPLKDKRVKILSGGEQQRVSIARAIISNPKMLLADEPTGNLDHENRDNILSILKKLNSEGMTIIVVTHDLEFAKKFNKIYEIKDGKINPVQI